MTTLEGRRVLVVGGSAGIGRAFATQAVAQGAQVVFAARRKDKLDEAVAEAGGGTPVAADICVESGCEQLIAETVAALGGPIDVVFISAGSAPMRMFKDTTPEDWKALLDLNVVGIHQVIRHALPHLAPGGDRVRARRAKASTSRAPRSARYVVSKVALERSIEMWRTEHPSVRFSVVAVGATVPTEFGNLFDMELLTFALEDWAKRGLAQADFMDASEVAVFLTEMYATALRFPGINVDHMVLRSPSAVTDEHQTTALTENL